MCIFAGRFDLMNFCELYMPFIKIFCVFTAFFAIQYGKRGVYNHVFLLTCSFISKDGTLLHVLYRLRLRPISQRVPILWPTEFTWKN